MNVLFLLYNTANILHWCSLLLVCHLELLATSHLARVYLWILCGIVVFVLVDDRSLLILTACNWTIGSRILQADCVNRKCLESCFDFGTRWRRYYLHSGHVGFDTWHWTLNWFTSATAVPSQLPAATDHVTLLTYWRYSAYVFEFCPALQDLTV